MRVYRKPSERRLLIREMRLSEYAIFGDEVALIGNGINLSNSERIRYLKMSTHEDYCFAFLTDII